MLKCECGGRGFLWTQSRIIPCVCAIEDYAKKTFKKIYTPVSTWSTQITVETKLKQWRRSNQVLKLDNDLRIDMCPVLYALSQTREKFLILDIMDIVNATFSKHRLYENIDHLSSCAENHMYLIVTMGLAPLNYKFGTNAVIGFINNFAAKPDKYVWILCECEKLKQLENTYDSHLYHAVKNLQPALEERA